MKKSTGFFLSLIFFLLGVISGFFISPVKNGIENNVGNNSHYLGKKEVMAKKEI